MECFKMIKVNLCIFFIICAQFLLSVKADDDNEAYCFQFRWVAPVFGNEVDKYNCSGFKGVPCIEELINTELPPNSTKFWESKANLCPVRSGNVCIKYTFIYNNNIVNTSSFCGKVTEDQTEPITSGCYEQHINGYLLKMCACQPRIGREPCNGSVEIKYSTILVVIMSLFIFISFT